MVGNPKYFEYAVAIMLFVFISGCTSPEKTNNTLKIAPEYDILKNPSPNLTECLNFMVGEKAIKEISGHVRSPTEFEKSTIKNCADLVEEENG